LDGKKLTLNLLDLIDLFISFLFFLGLELCTPVTKSDVRRSRSGTLSGGLRHHTYPLTNRTTAFSSHCETINIIRVSLSYWIGILEE
jgi:hypothetical protein